MRKVTYVRPKDFVDPFAPPKPKAEISEDEDVGDMDDILNDKPAENTNDSKKHSSHISSIRSLKNNKSSSPTEGRISNSPSSKQNPTSSPSKKASTKQSKSNPSTGHGSRRMDQGQGHPRDAGLSSTSGADLDDIENDEEAAQQIAAGLPQLMAHVHRHVMLTDCRRDFDLKAPLHDTEVLADIQCWKKMLMSNELKFVNKIHNPDSLESPKHSANSSLAGPPVLAAVFQIQIELLEGTQRQTSTLLLSDKAIEGLGHRPDIQSASSERVVAERTLTFGSDPNSEDLERLSATARELVSSFTVIVEDDLRGHPGNGQVIKIKLPEHLLLAEVIKREPRRKSVELDKDNLIIRSYVPENMYNQQSFQQNSISATGSFDYSLHSEEDILSKYQS